MHAEETPSWQNVLDCITQKAEEWKLLQCLEKKSEFEIVERCFKNERLRSYLKEWMELCLKGTVEKSSADSKACRTRGNEAFKKHRDAESLSLYTDCIRFAPYRSEEHALGFANRSAVLYYMGKYEDCLKDAGRALSFATFPNGLRLKLLLRQARCFMKLQNWQECGDTLDLAEKILSGSASRDVDPKLGVAMQEIQSLRSELNEVSKIEAIQSIMKKSHGECLPSLKGGNSEEIPFASAALTLRHSESKGRYVVANQDVKQGDVLFIENPYAFVVLPEQFKIHCHHCSHALIAPVPCRKCSDVLFCDETCEKNAYERYHRWECGGIPLMSAIGIAHLGLRIILVTGTTSQLLKKANSASQGRLSSKQTLGSLGDPYSTVYSLVPHINEMQPTDIFQYFATAELLTLFLVHKTDYFKNELSPGNKKDDVAAEVCALLLRHVTQLVCNAHAITKLDSDRRSADCAIDNINTVVSESQQRIATAIYPSASMMNHSCDPNIINSFYDEVLIVKASRNIPKGEEVFNCYGPHFQRMGTAERQAILQAQYFFTCDCSACTNNPGESFDPVQERLYALRCLSCSGPLLNEAPGREPAGSKIPQSDAVNCHSMVCNTCGLQQPISSLVSDAFCALSLFKQGCEDMDGGHIQDALNNLNRCKELQERALYHSNKDLTATYDMLAKCYATMGCYGESIQHLQHVLPAVEEQYGVNSVEVAHELQKLSDVMLCNLRTMETAPLRENLNSASEVVERGLSILSTHYGKWNQGWQDFEKKLQELKLMEDMVMVQGNFKSRMQL